MSFSKAITLQKEKCILHYSKEWSSPKGFDEAARKKRIQNRKKLGSFKAEKKTLPFSSVSHTSELGVWAESFLPIGVDVESKKRLISNAAQNRLGVKNEFDRLPTPIHLWVIKEACWKAFKEHPRLKQPKAISYIYVSDVKKSGQGYSFQFTTLKREFVRTQREKTQGFGYVTTIQGHLVAAAVLK